MKVADVMKELKALGNEEVREAYERQGAGKDQFGIHLADLRAFAKKLKKGHDLAMGLWKTGNTDAQLLATLVCKPKAFSSAELDAMVREIRYDKLLDWFVVNVVEASPHAEELRPGWKNSPEDLVGRAGWSLTTARVAKDPEGLDMPALLDQIEKEMKRAPAGKQFSMNHCLAEIGIHNPDLRKRAIAIGERLEVLKDYPTPKGCTSPFAPIWIAYGVERLKKGSKR